MFKATIYSEIKVGNNVTEGGHLNIETNYIISVPLIVTNILGLALYEEMLKSMIEKVEDGTLIQCTICKRSYKAAQTTNLKNHIEAKHIDNVRFTCAVCGGVFSSRASFRTHSRNFHKEISFVPFDVTQVDLY